MGVTLQPLVVSMGSVYEINTPFIPGAEPEPPAYTISTPFIPGFPPEDTERYSISTPVIPGVELDGTTPGGIDDLDETYPGKLRNRRADQLELLTVHDHQDETYLPTTVSGPDHGLWHLDETYEPTSLIVFSPTVDVSAITFYPIRRKSDTWQTGSKVQSLGVLLNPGPDVTVTFPRLPYEPDQPGDVV